MNRILRLIAANVVNEVIPSNLSMYTAFLDRSEQVGDCFSGVHSQCNLWLFVLVTLLFESVLQQADGGLGHFLDLVD